MYTSMGLGYAAAPTGDSYRHPLKRMPPPSGREALCTLMLQCKTSFWQTKVPRPWTKSLSVWFYFSAS